MRVKMLNVKRIVLESENDAEKAILDTMRDSYRLIPVSASHNKGKRCSVVSLEFAELDDD